MEHFYNKCLESEYVLGTQLNTDHLHKMRGRAHLPLPLWVLGGGCQCSVGRSLKPQLAGWEAVQKWDLTWRKEEHSNWRLEGGAGGRDRAVSQVEETAWHLWGSERWSVWLGQGSGWYQMEVETEASIRQYWIFLARLRILIFETQTDIINYSLLTQR